MAELNTPLKLGIFISGRGSNMEALIEACKEDDFPATISVVLSNNPEAQGLKTAKDAGIETFAINHKDFDSRAEFEAEILRQLMGHDIDLICLAGFMRVLSVHFIKSWPGPIINIHPSLLPKYKGLDAQKQALEDGAGESGCSVHFVVPEVDAGKIILQRAVPVMADDSEESLSARILEQEHIAYPEAVRMIAEGHVSIP